MSAVGGPTSTDIASFTGTSNQPNAILSANSSVLGITFAGSFAYTISSPSFTLTTGTSGIVNSSTASQTISAPLNIGDAAITDNGTGAGKLLISGTVNNGGNLLTLNGTGLLGTVSQVISGTGGLTKSGPGTWTVSGTNTYTGVTTISAGVLSVSVINDGGFAGNLGQAPSASSKIVLGGGTLHYTGSTASTDRGLSLENLTTSTIDIDPGVNLTISGVITGSATNISGALTKAGAGTLTLSGANSYRGPTTVSAGTLAFGASNVLYDFGGVLITGGTLAIGSFSDTVGGIVLSAGGITGTTGVLTGGSYDVSNASGTTTVSATLGGTGALTKTGAGTLDLSGANTYTGRTTVSAGTVNVTGSLSSSGALTVNGGTVNFSGNQQVASLSGSGGTISFGSGKALTLAAASSNSYGGILSGAGGLTLSSGATLTLGAGYTYSGPTIINSSATLTLNAPANSSSAYSLAGGTLARGSGVNVSAGSLMVSAPSFINFTSPAFAGTISFASSTTDWGAGNTLTLQNYNTTPGSQRLRFGNDSSGLSVNNLSLISISGFAGTIALNDQGFLTATAIPEPATYAAILGVSALGLAVYKRRRRRTVGTPAVARV